MKSGSNAVGVFDSGIGGVSVLREMQALLPNEDFVYLADSAYAPYGEKSLDVIQQRALSIATFLSEQPVKAIVVACNTATAAAIHILRQQFDIPVIGLEPAIKPAVAKSNNKVIGVLATQNTLLSDKYQLLKSVYSQQATIIDMVGHGLVEYIEAGKQDSAAFYQLLRRCMQPLQHQHIDTLVLGCTHYPFAKHILQNIVSGNVTIVDSGRAVAQQLHRQLQCRELLTSIACNGQVTYYNSAADHATLTRLLSSDLIHKVNI